MILNFSVKAPPKGLNQRIILETNNIDELSIFSINNSDDDMKIIPVIIAGIFFSSNESSPINKILKIVEKTGINDINKLKSKFNYPDKRLICRELDDKESVLIPDINKSDDNEILKNALILGLCSDYLYDPERDIILTNSKIKRVVALYRPEDFYGLYNFGI
jgi:hypothetical protein